MFLSVMQFGTWYAGKNCELIASLMDAFRTASGITQAFWVECKDDISAFTRVNRSLISTCVQSRSW